MAAHAVHNGLTQLEACHSILHGEKVGFGVLVQLRLEERLGGNRLAAQAHRQLLPLLQALELPVSLDDLGLGEVSLKDLQQVCEFACREGSICTTFPSRSHPAHCWKRLWAQPKSVRCCLEITARHAQTRASRSKRSSPGRRPSVVVNAGAWGQGSVPRQCGR